MGSERLHGARAQLKRCLEVDVVASLLEMDLTHLPLTYVARKVVPGFEFHIVYVIYTNICILLSKRCCIIIAFRGNYAARLQGHMIKSPFDRLSHHASTRHPDGDTGAATRMRVKLFAVTPVQTRQESPLRDVADFISRQKDQVSF